MSTLTNALAGLTVLSLVWYVTSSVSAWYRLRQIPGPFLASFSHTWLARQQLKGEIHTALRDLQKYGSLVRIGPNDVVTDDPEVLRRLSGVRNKYTKHLSYSQGARFHPTQDSMLNLLDNQAHDKIKAKTAAGYNGRDNPDFEAAVDSQVQALVGLIRRKYLSAEDETTPVDFAPLSRYYTLDTIGRLAYGQAFGHLDEGTDKYGYVAEVDKALKVVALIRSMPVLRTLASSSVMLKLMGPKTSAEKGLGKMMAVCNQQVANRLHPDAKPRNDMLGAFIRNGLTQAECEAEAMLQIIAGSDTTATTIRGTMMYLCSTPRAYSRLKTEIRSCLEQNAASSPITMEEAKKLPYLQAVIWEGFRMKNPLTLGHFKVVPPEGDTINGIFVPGGTAIGHNSVALTRNEAVFGHDVDIFRPERFFDAPEHKRVEMERALDILFGGGRWTCAGKSVAFMELNKTFFELLRAFDFQFVYPEKPWEEESNVTFSHKDMWMRITEATA